MLQLLIKNRFFFALCLVSIWTLIFLMPRFGNYLKTKRLHMEREKRLSQMKPIHELQKEEFFDNYLHAGMFHQVSVKKKYCLDSLDGKEGKTPGMWECHGEGKNQFWFIMKMTNVLRNKELCLEGPSDLGKPGDVSLQKCSSEHENQAWAYEDGVLKLSGGELCLEVDWQKKKVKAAVCSAKDNQKWKLETPAGY